jgi:hypothetical protein
MYRLSILSIFALGCGISDKTLLVDLDPDQIQKLCEDSTGGTYHCEMSGFTTDITVDASSCSEGMAVSSDCTATVGDWRACNDAYTAALEADACMMDGMPAECDPMMSCVGGGA